MDVLAFYLLAVLPIFIGGAFWIFDKRVVWWEWLIGSALALVLAAIMHLVAIHGATGDKETWSGQLMDARHNAAWREYYEYAVYRTEYYMDTESYTDSKGNTQTRTVMRSREVFDHWEPTTRWHQDTYETASNIDTRYDIDATRFARIAASWGGVKPVAGRRQTGEHASHMIGGDPNDYVARYSPPVHGFIWPVTKQVSFENKVRATPTTFSFARVPATVKVFPYPANSDPFVSDRLIGTALATVDQLAFDQMNARLGPTKRVNVILIGFANRDAMSAEWQQSAYVGGKKNDVVICWGGSNKAPTWVRAFGWTDSKTCLRALESIGLDKGFTTETLPLLEEEIKARYRLKDWDKAFAHIRVPAPMWSIWTYIGVLLVAQFAFWTWARMNEVDKGSVAQYPSRRYQSNPFSY